MAQGTTQNSHTGHCTRTTESTNVKVQSVYHRKLPCMYLKW